MLATFGSGERWIRCSARRPEDSSAAARATYNLWWPPAIIRMPESSTIVDFYALSYLVTLFARRSCAAKFDADRRPTHRSQQLGGIKQVSAVDADIADSMSITTFEVVAYLNFFS